MMGRGAAGGDQDAPVAREIAGLNVRTTGAGHPVLMLHGFGASSITWFRIAPTLSANHTLIEIDLRGFGDSPKPIDDRYRLEDHAENVLGVIEALKLSDFSMVGNSLGGGIAILVALRLAEAHAPSVRKLVLIDSIGYPQPIPLFIQALRSPLLGPLLLRSIPPRWSAMVVLRQAYRRPSRIDPALLETYSAPLRTKGGQHALIATARGLIPPHIDRLIREYRRIEAPVLLIWGRQDRIVPLYVGERLCDLFPSSRLVVLDDCGHVPQEEQPSPTAKLLAEFL